MSASLKIRDTANYRVTYYPKPSAQLTIVFISAGRSAPGEPVEEFKRTLERFDTATLFVLDRHARWYNYEETAAMWAELNAVARQYDRVGAIGESMGGCGALLARREMTGVGRVLAMSPQHSIMKPFVDFDTRYEPVSRSIKTNHYIHFSDGPAPDKAVLLFGTRDWRDYIHSAMFLAHGFAPLYIQGATHNVAAFLKAEPGNGLLRLVAAFLDWTRPFGGDTVRSMFPRLATSHGMELSHSFASEATSYNVTLMANLAAAFARETGQLLGPNVAIGAAATQSSLSEWSNGDTPERDAARAISGVVSGSYAFHTAAEDGPWWQVDLGSAHDIQEIRLFNFLADPAIMRRSAQLTIALSDDGNAWQVVLRRQDPSPFGGTDGSPLVWRPGGPCRTRMVRVQAEGHTYLHLNQVQVFGHRVEVTNPFALSSLLAASTDGPRIGGRGAGRQS